MPLPETARALGAGTLPPGAVCVTFDDGYANNHDVALPILQKWKVPATVFVATGFLDGGRMWNDTVIESVRRASAGRLALDALGVPQQELNDAPSRIRAIDAVIKAIKHRPYEERLDCVRMVVEACRAKLPDDLMLTSAQVGALARAGVTIGSHTVSHPILTSIDE
jgi:peptidoglycan/xylan/chitin deacetylase (PgdA/CDA1 family)